MVQFCRSLALVLAVSLPVAGLPQAAFASLPSPAPASSAGISDEAIAAALAESKALEAAAASDVGKRRQLFELLLQNELEPAAAALKSAHALDIPPAELSPAWTKARSLNAPAGGVIFSPKAMAKLFQSAAPLVDPKTAEPAAGGFFDGSRPKPQSPEAAAPVAPAPKAEPKRTRLNVSVNSLNGRDRLLGRDARYYNQMVPYYGKNPVHYDKFDWHVYTTDHFDIYYYPDIEGRLEDVASYAESAYEYVRRTLGHDLRFRVPLILYKTHTHFQQTNTIPGAGQEGVLAFADMIANRMVMPVDWQGDRLHGLIVHELTHIFEYDILPVSMVQTAGQFPLWVPEGLSDYQRGTWDALDLMMVRDAAVNDQIPRLTDERDLIERSSNARLPYNLGHAAFEFMEHQWGRVSVQAFLEAMRRNIIAGGDSPYQAAFKLAPEDFDKEFAKYLKERFKDDAGRQKPEDYGAELSPDPRKTRRYVHVLSPAPSPGGDAVAAYTFNFRDRDLDLVLISPKDGKILKNLTPGVKTKGYDYLDLSSPELPMLAWTPEGDKVVLLARTGRGRSLLFVNVADGKIARKVELKDLDQPESPKVSPDGKTVLVAALRGAQSDLFLVDLVSGEIRNLTNDKIEDKTPAFTPDGKAVVWSARINQSYKLFRLDLASGERKQLTFGLHDDLSPQVSLEGDKVYFQSTGSDPKALDAEKIYNVWSLKTETGELVQHTDALGGNLVPGVVRPDKEKGGERLSFVTYHKGRWGLSTVDPKTSVRTANASDFGPAVPHVEFAPPIAHQLQPQHQRKKGVFEKLTFVKSPLTVGVNSGGDFMGGGYVAATDLMGDHQFSFLQNSVNNHQTTVFTYVNMTDRLQWAVQGFSQKLYFYGQNAGLFGEYTPYLTRDQAMATQSVKGANAIGIYPLDAYRRLEFSGGLLNYSASFADEAVQALAQRYQDAAGIKAFANQSTTLIPLSAALVGETTVFREFGPLSGSTYRLAAEIAPKIAGAASRQTLDFDARKYLKIGDSGVFAVRARGLRSWGERPDLLYFGGNSEMRGYDYMSFVGNKALHANAELRFPLIDAFATPIGVFPGFRGSAFVNVGGAGFDGRSLKFLTSKDSEFTPIVDYQKDEQGRPVANPYTGLPVPVYGDPVPIKGLRLQDARAAYGFGIESFILGMPIHVDWSWKTLFNKEWEAAVAQSTGEQFRQRRVSFWMGFDF